MQPKQLARSNGRLPDPAGQARFSYPVLHRQDACLVLLSLGVVAGLRRVVRDGTSLLGECEVGVARAISFHHHWIARQRSGDTKLLLRPVNVRDATTGWWLDQTAKPDARAKNEFRVARLISACACSESR
jgi:hypothetical protein